MIVASEYIAGFGIPSVNLLPLIGAVRRAGINVGTVRMLLLINRFVPPDRAWNR